MPTRPALKLVRILLVSGGIAMALFCLAMGGAAVYFHRADAWKPGTFTIATGHVIRLDAEESRGGGSSGSVYYPVVRYSAANQTYTTRGRVGSNPARYQVGEAVHVKYPNQDPAAGVLDTALERTFLPGLLMAICLCGLVFAAACIFLGWYIPKAMS